MLPKEIHIKSIERFHDKMKSLSEELNEIKDDESKRDRAYKLARDYYELSQIWSKIDELCEFTIEHEIDVMENEN
ncbi:MAG: hypothetical protein SLAVMIC_00900 [uncultured marine phage]|uniref:Uncharacterized protein n=1 Tax=uncultured marine phage TaxID=707152 RepID=A0A8D9FSI6_9VIRU|nr:MAG: hypothetical protein SLAVMIC_00900 [uncultured marine phage]